MGIYRSDKTNITVNDTGDSGGSGGGVGEQITASAVAAAAISRNQLVQLWPDTKISAVTNSLISSARPSVVQVIGEYSRSYSSRAGSIGAILPDNTFIILKYSLETSTLNNSYYNFNYKHIDMYGNVLGSYTNSILGRTTQDGIGQLFPSKTSGFLFYFSGICFSFPSIGGAPVINDTLDAISGGGDLASISPANNGSFWVVSGNGDEYSVFNISSAGVISSKSSINKPSSGSMTVDYIQSCVDESDNFYFGGVKFYLDGSQTILTSSFGYMAYDGESEFIWLSSAFSADTTGNVYSFNKSDGTLNKNNTVTLGAGHHPICAAGNNLYIGNLNSVEVVTSSGGTSTITLPDTSIVIRSITYDPDMNIIFCSSAVGTYIISASSGDILESDFTSYRGAWIHSSPQNYRYPAPINPTPIGIDGCTLSIVGGDTSGSYVIVKPLYTQFMGVSMSTLTAGQTGSIIVGNGTYQVLSYDGPKAATLPAPVTNSKIPSGSGAILQGSNCTIFGTTYSGNTTTSN